LVAPAALPKLRGLSGSRYEPLAPGVPMHRTRIGRLPALILPVLLWAGPAHAITLDAFTDAFPPNDCLPYSGQLVVFAGEFCDGFYCPPDPLASCEVNTASQQSLPGVWNGSWRAVTVTSQDGVTPIHAEVRTFSGLLLVSSSAGYGHELEVRYGGATGYQMNLDLAGLGATHVVVPIPGDITPARLLYARVQLGTLEHSPPGGVLHSVSLDVTISTSGSLTLPLSSFPPVAGFSLSDVDLLSIQVSECPIGQGCYGVPARNYT